MTPSQRRAERRRVQDAAWDAAMALVAGLPPDETPMSSPVIKVEETGDVYSDENALALFDFLD